jgi:TolB protein
LTPAPRASTVSLVRAVVLLTLALACSPPTGPREVRGPDADREAAVPPGRFVVAEHAHRGGRLVLVDERGRRVRDLTAPPDEASVDAQPSFSPDGRFVAFASSRGRGAPDQTSIWILALADGATARLTDDAGRDLTPAFAPDGRSLAFASTRAGSLDLWTVELDGRDAGLPAAGRLARLTDDPGAELSPAWSPDGARLAYTFAERPRERAVMLVARDGSARARLVAGETPTFSPDGAQIAYAARAEGREDADLWLIAAAGGAAPRRLSDERMSDETMPRFSRDGRFLFATAIVREDESRRAMLASLVFLELDDLGAGLRALQEPIPTTRNGADVAPLAIDADALRKNPRYLDAVRRTLVQ